MQAVPFAKTALAAVTLLVLSNCAEQFATQNGFQARYFTARKALESGQYEQARRVYGKLIAEAGPLVPRLELEYAHAELRAGNYDAAARQAEALAQGQTGEARGAALAVQGTAQHELALQMLHNGDIRGGEAMLKTARTALAEVVGSYPDLDPLGSMAGRLAAIEARLKRL